MNELTNVGVDQFDDKSDEKSQANKWCNTREEDNHNNSYFSEEAMEELYHEPKSSVLATTILIMTLYTIRGMSNKFTDQLFTLVHKHIFSDENQLPKNYHVSKTLNQKLELNYNTIHVFQPYCILFREKF